MNPATFRHRGNSSDGVFLERNGRYADQSESSLSRCLRIGTLSIIGGSLLFIIIDAFTGKQVEGVCIQFLDWVQRNPSSGVLAMIVVYAVATVLFVPGSILTVGAGFAFGTAFHSTAMGVALASLVCGINERTI